MASAILVPLPGMEPTSPTVEAWSLNCWTIRWVLLTFYKWKLLIGRKVVFCLFILLMGFLRQRKVVVAIVVQSLTHVWLSPTPWTTMPVSSVLLSPGICSNSCPLNQWCYLTTSSSAAPFSFNLQSFPESGSFPMSQLFTSGDQRFGPSASASVLLMNIQGWFHLELTGLISLLSKGLSSLLQQIQKHTFFGAKAYLRSNSHICTWLLEKL